MNIKKGDTVQIMAGKDRGKRGNVLKSFPKRAAVIVENLNLVRRHVRPKTAGAKGEIVTTARPIHVAKVRLVCSRCGRPVRVGVRRAEDRLERYCKKCGNVI